MAAGGVFLQEFVSLKNSGKHLRKRDFLQNYRTCSLPATREPNGQGRAVMRGGVEVGADWMSHQAAKDWLMLAGSERGGMCFGFLVWLTSRMLQGFRRL